ncbi:OLC1v1039014C1 [Oldenlandia corymbosa var. corymbosa]|uniref:OLC1v1039014C1 n=1 Tax=Oldenlandia corymbosa var. corymbosa TaxID=529605 RepID=A0AAV1D161_OLDCO|nr:OLC1v1039014C1 [Oldenlandia corymbosa var. corymbosa]
MSEQVPPPPPPEVLVLGPPGIFRTKNYEKLFDDRFRVLKPWQSPVPLFQFLQTHAQNTRALVCGGGFKHLGSETLDRLPSLGVVVVTAAGLNHIDLQECRRRGIAVAYASTIFSPDVADLAVGLLIDVLRRITAGNRFVKSGIWPVKSVEGSYPLATKLSHKRVGIVGLGSIGQEVAKRLEAFDCKISYHSRSKKSSVSYQFYSDVRELAADCDILIICCALNDQTNHLITKEVLEALGKHGVIINIARGAIIDQKELVQFLQEGRIAGAGLDVLENEPYVPPELCELNNVVLSPHFAVYTEESFRDLCELVVGNLDAFFSNQPLLSPVLKE